MGRSGCLSAGVSVDPVNLMRSLFTFPGYPDAILRSFWRLATDDAVFHEDTKCKRSEHEKPSGFEGR